MNPHRPKKPASDESTTDEEEMIVYDVEDEIESNPDYVKENAKFGSCANNPKTHSLTHSLDIVFCWLPSHVGIIGNEQADSAAKSATTHLPLAVPLSDMKRVIMHHIFNIWQESWSQQLDNKLHSVKPVIEHGRDANAKN
ncbi:RNase H domain-containing protein [Trichonephila clavipes]|nr:RNase H domain-containing protein [Trichonephila clavipes]